MATLDAPAPVNLVRSIFLCNIFNFFFAASKACLLPFLTVYFKLLGLSATQTGLIMAAKTAISLVFAPLWAKCSSRCGRRRCMLMFSLFVMSATYMSLIAVPSIDENAFATRCPVLNNDMVNLSAIAETHQNDHPETTPKPVEVATPVKSHETTTVAPPIKEENSSVASKMSSTSKPELPIVAPTTASKSSKTTLNNIQTSTPKPVLSTMMTGKDKEIAALLKDVLLTVGLTAGDLENASEEELVNYLNMLMQSRKGKKLLVKALEDLTEEDSNKLYDLLHSETKNRKRRAVDTSDTDGSNADPQASPGGWKMLLHKMRDLQNQIRDTENQIFIVVMIIMMVGESLCCPIEKLADDGWFEFLESIDDLEKYGMQRVWSSFAYILMPLIVTLSVDNTICLFGLKLHPFMLHFYLFAGFLGITLLISFCYPMATCEKYRYASKVMKGVTVVCCNLRNLLFTVTLFITGIIYASYQNFLFWVLLDMGSKEITLGLCLTMASLAEIPMLLFNEKLVSKIGSGGVISVSVLFLSGRCLYYSFLPSPWAVIPAEITHAITHTALWGAVLSTSSFNSSPALSRSIRSILSSVYFGIGFSIGSLISGFVYDLFGPAILFQAGAVLAIGWFPVLCCGVRCCRERDRTEVKYARLLTSDDASDDSDSMEDDWLEKALKDK